MTIHEGGQEFSRILGRRKMGGVTPGTITQDGIDWINAMNKSVKLRIPKGVFRYKSHEEANADMDRWLAESVESNVRNQQ